MENVNNFTAKTKINAVYFRLFLTAAIFGLALFSFNNTGMAEESECSQLTGDDKDKCKELEKKAEAYRDLIEIKNKQQATLQKQINLIDAEKQKNQIIIQKTQDQVMTLSEQISLLEREILGKEEQIQMQKKILTGLIRSYYENYQQGMLNIVLLNRNFSETLSQADYVQQSSFKVQDVLLSIREAKIELEKQQTELKSKKTENEQLKERLEDRKQELQSSENQKTSLLTHTKGEESKYQQLLARV